MEFLTPERGRGDQSTLTIKPLGVKAVQLRFLDMLFDRSLVVREGSVSVRIPNPLNFCIHKLIIAQRRLKPEKRRSLAGHPSFFDTGSRGVPFRNREAAKEVATIDPQKSGESPADDPF